MKIGLLAIGLAVTVQAAPIGTKASPARATETVRSSGSKSLYLSLAAALAVIPQSGETAAGIDYTIVTQVAPSVYLGGDFGLHLWGAADKGTNNVTGLELLPTLIYMFGNADRVFQPYLGGAAGPYIRMSSDTVVQFALLARPGANLSLSRNVGVNLEAKFGQLGTEFFFQPQAGILFQL